MPNNVAVEFTIGQRQAVETAFTINASPTKVSQLENDLDFQTKDEVDTALEAKQDVLTAGEGITIEDNVISATGATITIDDELSTTSENPVQNKVVTSAINQNHTEIGNIGQTIGTYGNIVTHDADEFATASQGEKADSALQSGDNISELNNNAGYITSADLPTVNNATLTIQKNSVTAGTFTANSSTDTIINMNVPTTASDVGALPSSTKYGASLTLSINSSTYVVTAQLKDQDGNNLGTAQTIDLPLESVVVSGSYDDQTKKIILTLQNGSTVEFSVADLVSGLQTEITSQNMLDADLVDDSTSTNKFVTSSEKSAISTAVQPSDLATVATTGSYDDLIDKPTIPAAQVNSDWNAVSGVAEILNKPSLATVATSGAYSDLTGTPTIPTVNDATLTIQKNGVDVQTFTANASTNATANITVPTDTADLTNGAGFITSSDLPTNYVTTNTAQDISAQKTFLGEKAILFKQTATADKLGFTLYNTSNTELGAFEWRPNTIGSGALLNLNMSYSSSNYLGFRYWGTAVNIIAPKVATAGDYYIPVNVTNGNTTVTATSAGTVNISSLLPTVNNATLTIQKNGTNVATFTANASSNVTANISVPNTVSSVSSSSTNADAVGAKLFYDTCGDIETLINAL